MHVSMCKEYRVSLSPLLPVLVLQLDHNDMLVAGLVRMMSDPG